MVDFTVAIPTYNGAKRVPDVLQGLQSQTHLEGLSWEVVIVDNNSDDNLEATLKAMRGDWRTDCTLSYRFEPEPGAAFARQRALAAARGKYVGFLDDDNIPAPDWVAKAYAFAEAHPGLGAMGSEIQGDFSEPPPDYLAPLHCYLGIIQRGAVAHRYEPQAKVLPPGAGLVVRRSAWLEAVPPRLFLNHTNKQAGLASEDLEAVLYLQKGGWEIWHNPELKVRHKIAPERCQKEYLLALVRCIGSSKHHLRMLRLPPWQRPLMTVGYWLNDLRKLAKHFWKYRGAIDNNVLALCDRELIARSLLSPFFLTQIRLQRWQSQRQKTRKIFNTKTETLSIQTID